MPKTNAVLLDVNVLLALAWPNHPFHRAATNRMARRGQHWATCAFTQLGFIRLSANPAVVSPAVSPSAAATLLAEMTGDSLHSYLDRLPLPVELIPEFQRLFGHNQVTDAYLIEVARLHGVQLLTLDVRLKSIADVELVPMA